MLGWAIRLIMNKWAKLLAIAGSCLATACLLLLIGSGNVIAQPKKKPGVTPHKGAPGEEAASDEPSSKGLKKTRKRKEKDKNSVAGVSNFSTNNFLVHTDLADEKAEE